VRLAAGSGPVLCAVSAVSTVLESGLFLPVTLEGTLVVGGVVASAYSEWFLDHNARLPLLSAYSHDTIYHAILAPARLLFRLLGPAAARELQDKIDIPSLMVNKVSRPLVLHPL
jgi:hedgehog